MLVYYCFRSEHEKYFPPAVAYVASLPDNTDLSEYEADELFHAMGFTNSSQYVEAYPKLFSVDDDGIGSWIHQRFCGDTAHIPICSRFWGTPTNIVSIHIIENEKVEYTSCRINYHFDYGVEIIFTPTVKDVKKYNDKLDPKYKDLWFCSDWDESIISRLSKQIRSVVSLLSKIQFS